MVNKENIEPARKIILRNSGKFTSALAAVAVGAENKVFGRLFRSHEIADELCSVIGVDCVALIAVILKPEAVLFTYGAHIGHVRTGNKVSEAFRHNKSPVNKQV